MTEQSLVYTVTSNPPVFDGDTPERDLDLAIAAHERAIAIQADVLENLRAKHKKLTEERSARKNAIQNNQ